MSIIEKIGLFLFVVALAIFTLSLGLNSYTLTSGNISAKTEFHKNAILKRATDRGLLNRTVNNNFDFISQYKSVIADAQSALNTEAAKGLPEGINEWDFKLGDWETKAYVTDAVKKSSGGLVHNNKGLFWLLTFGLGMLGGLLFILPKFNLIPGIKNNHIYQNSMTRGLTLNVRTIFLLTTVAGTLIYGVYYMNKRFVWPLVTLLLIGLIVGLVFFRNREKDNRAPRSASPNITGWLGVITGTYLIGFYILLYWFPEYITAWVDIADPASLFLSGKPASKWFLYGMLYTVIVLVMGIRMIAKYQHNSYQMIRSGSVMFFQTGFAFLIPQIMSRLNQPSVDFKNIWPLDYSFFFDYNIKGLIASGNIGLFILVWGIALALIGVPVFTYFFGKRWYCSWVCGCGGLAETLGDPYRQLSDKSVRAWKYERYIIHGVLVAAVVMTILVLVTYFTGKTQVLFLDSGNVRTWYGFLIGSAFAGIVGTGFYPLTGNRTWCRFGCPLAAYLGLVQRFKSRFRITVNGSQCISCGNCSTYCEMGIDVRHYAQRGQDIVRSSCVGCGVCAAVCPRGVLRLENASADINTRTDELRTIHIAEGDVRLLM